MKMRKLVGLAASAALGILSGLASCGESGGGDDCRLGSVGCACALGTCEAGLECTDADICVFVPGDGDGDGDGTGDGDGDGDGGTGPGPNCGQESPVVSGSLQTSVTELGFDSVTAEVTHKQDIDEDEDGCINTVELTFQSGVGCTLVVLARNLIDGDKLAVAQLEFTADSQCPNFSDNDEGEYSANPGGLSNSYIELSQASIGESNVSESCFSGNLRVVLDATLSDGVKDFSFTGGALTVDGDFPTDALEHLCPADVGTVCEEDQNDVACVTCTKASCCNEITDCATDEDCACVLSCIEGGGETLACLTSCGVSMPESPLSEVLSCSGDNCPDDC